MRGARCASDSFLLPPASCLLPPAFYYIIRCQEPVVQHGRRATLLVLLGVSVAAAQQPAPSSPFPVLVYERRPLRVPITCRAEDFEAAGLQCTEEEPCRVFLELAAVEAAGPKIALVGNLHTVSATLSSLALMSDDAGTTWREPLGRLAATGFEAVQLLNEQNGWISVQPQVGLASDPYLLGTSDGGTTWQKFPIWSEEGRAGLLQQFYFDSKEHGLALIDRSQSGDAASRYELYETPNGGATWMLRETGSRPIAPKWPVRRASDWRLREEDKAKTYDLERRVGDTWRRMASFSTALGVCKALETKQPAPPGPDP